MLLAHLRGLLKPYYKQGEISRLAERMVLRGLASELSAERLSDLSATESRNLGLLGAGDRVNAWNKIDERLKRADRRRRMMLSDPPDDQPQTMIDSMTQLYYALEKAGVIKDIDSGI